MGSAMYAGGWTRYNDAEHAAQGGTEAGLLTGGAILYPPNNRPDARGTQAIGLLGLSYTDVPVEESARPDPLIQVRFRND